MYAYPALADVQVAVPILRSALGGEDVAAKAVVHAAYVVAGFGLSLYPGDPALFGSAEQAYGREDAIADLEQLAAPPSEEKFSNRAIPWNLLLPIIMQLLQEWLKK